MQERFTPENAEERGLIFGRNSVMEVVRSGRTIDRVYIAKGTSNGSLIPIIEKCRAKKIPIKEVPAQKLDFMTGNATHQGIVVAVAAKSYCDLDSLIDEATKDSKQGFIMLCDGLEDPHNLGAIIRTAEATGVDGIIIPKHRSVALNATVAKSASGALEYVNICKVTNLPNTIDILKERGFWVYGADMNGSPWYEPNFKGHTAIIIGSEGNGISRLVKEKCDGIISMPMCGKINSLNASVAAGVLMYEVARQRL